MRIFISYSHDNDDHKARVKGLADRLKIDLGSSVFTVIYDRDCSATDHDRGFVSWSEDQAENAECVLMVFTESYGKCWDGTHPKGKRLGATWETRIIKQRIYEVGGDMTFCRVLIFSETDKQYIPSSLKSSPYLILDRDYPQLISWLQHLAPPPPQMVRIPGGTFLMGSPESEPVHQDNERQHEVQVPDFAIGKFAVTFGEYDFFCEATHREKPKDVIGRKTMPVINVSWQDAVAYTIWLSEQTGRRFRLPTEAEWEYAARGGSSTAYWWGDEFNNAKANAWENDPRLVPVDQYPPNQFGLYNILGNVAEWTGSIYSENFDGSESHIANPGDAGNRVIRGGNYKDEPSWVRCAYRYGNPPSVQCSTVGFRIVEDLG